jgi:hypothetical protein
MTEDSLSQQAFGSLYEYYFGHCPMSAVYWRLALLPSSCNNTTQPILPEPLDQANFISNNSIKNCKHRQWHIRRSKLKLITQPENIWRNKHLKQRKE